MRSLIISLILTICSVAHAGGDPYVGAMTLQGVEREHAHLYVWRDYEIRTYQQCSHRRSKVRAYIYLWDHDEPLTDGQCDPGECFLDFGHGRKCEVESFEKVYPPGC